MQYQQSHQGDGNQLVSLQEETEHLRLELEKAHGERKVVEDSYIKEKDLLRKVCVLANISCCVDGHAGESSPFTSMKGKVLISIF